MLVSTPNFNLFRLYKCLDLVDGKMGIGRTRVPVVEAQPPERRPGRRNRAVAVPGIQDVGAVVGEVQAPLPLPIQAPLSIERQPALQGPVIYIFQNL